MMFCVKGQILGRIPIIVHASSIRAGLTIVIVEHIKQAGIDAVPALPK
jgi:dihydrodipicolinate synthase/N-acetylneuraminate lyase